VTDARSGRQVGCQSGWSTDGAKRTIDILRQAPSQSWAVRRMPDTHRFRRKTENWAAIRLLAVVQTDARAI
jgi:hypothetical protein